MKNLWCDVLGIQAPRLESVKDHRDASTYTLLIVVLLERGGPMTLPEVAARFEEAGVAEAPRALSALKRCRPGRAPVYRDGDRYHLDPHDDELDLWVFRLGLRPPKIARVQTARPEPPPLPGPDVALTVAELDEAWKDAGLTNWSVRRLVLAVLDAKGKAMLPQEVIEFVAARTEWHPLRHSSGQFDRRGSAVEVGPDGRWSVAPDADKALAAVRSAVRDRVEAVRRYAAMRPDPVAIRALGEAWERRRETHAAELAEMRRVLLYAFPAKKPEAVALLDVGAHELATFVGAEVATVRERLGAFDIVGAMDVRSLLRALDFDPGERRLGELGPPQKTRRLNRSGRTLTITTKLLIQGSCGISRPFGDEKKLAIYLTGNQDTKLRRRLEANVKSLYALYQYGRLHGAARLRWGFLDELLPVRWIHRDEPRLYDLEKIATETNRALEVVVGSAPGWNDPWARARPAFVEVGARAWDFWLVDEDGYGIDESEVQLARLSGPAPRFS